MKSVVAIGPMTTMLPPTLMGGKAYLMTIEEATKLLNHCAEHERGVFIGPVFYGWEKIRELFSDSLHDVAAEEDRRDHKRGLYGPDPGEVR